jgi:hypothetical protein
MSLTLNESSTLNARLSRSFEDGDDLCPRWWKWPFPHRLTDEHFGPQPEPWRSISLGGQITLKMFRALTIYAMGFQYHDRGERQQLQELALGQLGELQGQLQEASRQGGSVAFEEGDDLCPRWWRWPFPHRMDDIGKPEPVPWKEIPAGGQIALKMFRALTVYNMAFQYQDEAQSAELQQVALGQLDQLQGELRQTLAS